MNITKDSPIEELIAAWPGTVSFLIREGLPCVVCGEPFWGTLAELARKKGWDSARIDQLVRKFQAEMPVSD